MIEPFSVESVVECQATDTIICDKKKSQKR